MTHLKKYILIIFVCIVRWIYFGEELYNGEINRLTFNGNELTVIIKGPTTFVYGIELGMLTFKS